MSSSSKLIRFLIIVLPLLRQSNAHMEMSYPFPLRSRLDPQTPDALKDYNMVAPLHLDGSDYPCKNYNKDQPVRPVMTYEAGGSYNMSIVGGAQHMGGSCQLSLSYDNGATFKVIKSMIGGCPLTSDYTFTIPAFAPSGSVLLAWTWFNLVGNREMYMNCAAVNVKGRVVKREESASSSRNMKALPDIFVANIGSKSQCTTIEKQQLVFPDPGSDVVYGDGVTERSNPAPGDCGPEVVSYGSTGPQSTSATERLPTAFPPTTFSTAVRPSSLVPNSPSSLATTATAINVAAIMAKVNRYKEDLSPTALYAYNAETITEWAYNSHHGAMFGSYQRSTTATIPLFTSAPTSDGQTSSLSTYHSSSSSSSPSPSTPSSAAATQPSTSDLSMCHTGTIHCLTR